MRNLHCLTSELIFLEQCDGFTNYLPRIGDILFHSTLESTGKFIMNQYYKWLVITYWFTSSQNVLIIFTLILHVHVGLHKHKNVTFNSSFHYWWTSMKLDMNFFRDNFYYNSQIFSLFHGICMSCLHMY